MRKHPIKEILPLKVYASHVALLSVGSRWREGCELREKPTCPALGSRSVNGAQKIWRKPGTLPGIKGFLFCRQAGAAPVIQQHQCGRETPLAEHSLIWQAKLRIYAEICNALSTPSTIGPLAQPGWGCSRFAFRQKALTQEWVPHCKRNAVS